MKAKHGRRGEGARIFGEFLLGFGGGGLAVGGRLYDFKHLDKVCTKRFKRIRCIYLSLTMHT